MAETNLGFAGMDPTQAGQAMAQWAEQLQRKAELFQGLQQQMTQLSATVTSADGFVRVTVDSQGVPTELTVTDRARGADPTALSARLMTCLHAAQSQLASQVHDLVQDVVPGEGDPDAERIIASYHDRFPDEPAGEPKPDNSVLDVGRIDEDDTPPSPPPRRARHHDGHDDEDGWGDQSILR